MRLHMSRHMVEKKNYIFFDYYANNLGLQFSMRLDKNICVYQQSSLHL